MYLLNKLSGCILDSHNFLLIPAVDPHHLFNPTRNMWSVQRVFNLCQWNTSKLPMQCMAAHRYIHA